MIIMVFGHIPTWAGGRQESGLANVIYQLAKHGSGVEKTDIYLAATDCYVPKRIDEELTVLGWTKCSLLEYIVKHPVRAMKICMRLLELKRRYPLKERWLGLYLKSVFLDKTIAEVNPQVLHFHGSDAAWYLDLVPEAIKVVVTFHGMNGLDKNIEQYNIRYNMEKEVFLSKRVNETFFICTQLVEMFKKSYGNNGKRNQVIFNSFDNNKFYYNDKLGGYTNGVVTLCTVASLSELKGQMRVLSALSEIPDKEKFIYFCIGSDSIGLSKTMKEFAKEHNIKFEYRGKMKPDEIRNNLYNASYMIMPSSSEGFGLSYLEAIACGVPVIMPKTIPIAKEKELINSANSILLEDSSVESIRQVLIHICNNHFDRRKVANSIKNLTWDEVSRQYIYAFHQL